MVWEFFDSLEDPGIVGIQGCSGVRWFLGGGNNPSFLVGQKDRSKLGVRVGNYIYLGVISKGSGELPEFPLA